MKQTLEKLKSNTGSTLILALLFMLICVFVGGSVLVAATVNGDRLSGKREEQQALLNQRSIVSVMVSELSDGDTLSLSLPIKNDGGLKSCPIPNDANETQRMVYLAAQRTFNDAQAGTPYSAEHSSVHFTVTDPAGNVINCRTECSANYTVYIRFDDAPQIRLKLSGRYSESESEISWYKAVVEKDGSK